MAPLIAQLENVTVRPGGREILTNFNWRLEAGECAVILGPSGRGKSVMLQTLLGFLRLAGGRVAWPGVPGEVFSETAVIFQNDALLEDSSVAANLALALHERADLFEGPFPPESAQRIERALEDVELDPARVMPLLPMALSGGMRRRVALARALIRRPRVLIADEPTSGLDPVSSAAVYDLLGHLIERDGLSAVIVSHDPLCAVRLGRPVYFFNPVSGSLPRWPEPPAEFPAAERLALLEGWLGAQKEKEAVPAVAGASPTAQEKTISAGPASATLERLLHGLPEQAGRALLLIEHIARRPAAALLARDLRDYGFATLPLLALIFLMFGVVLQIQAETAVVDYGLSNRLPELVALSLLRMAPILTGFLMAGRCGSAIAARIGWMRAGGQFVMLQTVRIPPERALFPPIFWAMVLAAPLLTLAGIAIGACGALLTLVSPLSQARITREFFIEAFPAFLTPAELLSVLGKGLLMGAGIAIIAWSGGAAPKRSPDDVTRAITRTLVYGFIWCALIDAGFSLLFSF